MVLCLDIGNTQIYGGVFDGDEIKLRFRRSSRNNNSSDEIGMFLRSVLRDNGINPETIESISCCSVVPDIIHSLKNGCRKYFGKVPFILQPGVKTGLKIKYRNPLEVGSDRIANSIAATHMYPNKNLVIVDFGTAITFCAVSKERDYLGGVISAGLKISMNALEANTAKLPTVEIVQPESVLGRSTVESIQSGLFYGSVGLVREIVSQMTIEAFKNEKPFVIGTGGMSSLFDRTSIFDEIDGDLVLRGLYLSLKMNL